MNNQKTIQFPTKTCSECKKTLPLTSEFWHKHQMNTDGFVGKCKKCLILKYKKNKKQIAINYQKNKKQIAINYQKNKTENKLYRTMPAKYSTYANQLTGIEITRKMKNADDIIEVTCAYCGKFHTPSNTQIKKRIASINGKAKGSCLLYCSDGCKLSCPIYGQKKWPKGFKQATSRESNPLLRQLVLKRDDYTCQKCGAISGGNTKLHCHHTVPATQNPMTTNDPSVCVCLCSRCHKEVHKQPGCGYYELRCG